MNDFIEKPSRMILFIIGIIALITIIILLSRSGIIRSGGESLIGARGKPHITAAPGIEGTENVAIEETEEADYEEVYVEDEYDEDDYIGDEETEAIEYTDEEPAAPEIETEEQEAEEDYTESASGEEVTDNVEPEEPEDAGDGDEAEEADYEEEEAEIWDEITDGEE